MWISLSVSNDYLSIYFIGTMKSIYISAFHLIPLVSRFLTLSVNPKFSLIGILHFIKLQWNSIPNHISSTHVYISRIYAQQSMILNLSNFVLIKERNHKTLHIPSKIGVHDFIYLVLQVKWHIHVLHYH